MRTLPSPTSSFTIPSLHDDKLLACRLYHPKRHASSHPRAAIIAHPYAPLGGSYDDPVVNAVGAEVLSCGWIVMTFNFRGARSSQGKTSWTGTAERADYESAAGFLIHYLSKLHCDPPGKRLDIVFGGYSYGSMIAVDTAPIPTILAALNTMDRSDAATGILARATELSSKYAKQMKSDKRNASDSSDIDNLTPDNLPVLTINAYFLLVSPLLPPISTLIALPFAHGAQRSEQSSRKLETVPVLAVYGELDGFTSSKRLDSWAARMFAINAQFQSAKVEAAGHFWHEEDALHRLVRAVQCWLTSVDRDSSSAE